MSRYALLFTALVGAARGACPKVGVQQGLNLTEYTRASWYPQMQQVTKYQAVESLFCVVATYNDTKGDKPVHVPLFKGATKAVFNHDSRGAVNGSSEGAQLCARARRRGAGQTQGGTLLPPQRRCVCTVRGLLSSCIEDTPWDSALFRSA